LSGTNPSALLRAANLVSLDGNAVTVYGSPVDDTFEFIAGATHQITVNDIVYDGIDATEIRIDGGWGTDSVTLVGTDADETAGLHYHGAQLNGPNYSVTAVLSERVSIDGGGGSNMARFYDSPDNDLLLVSPDSAKLFVNVGENDPTKSAYAVAPLTATNFSTVHAFASSGGTDEARLTGSTGDDTLMANPIETRLWGAEYFMRVKSFDAVVADALSADGDNDTAQMFDSAGDDTFRSIPKEGRFFGEGFDNRARGFEQITATSSKNDGDLAEFTDSTSDDHFVAAPEYSSLEGAGFHNLANNFPEVLAVASRGGYDTAELLDSTGNDTFTTSAVSWGLEGQFSGTGFRNRAQLFENLQASSRAGGVDEMRMSDSTGNDTFIAAVGYAAMESTAKDSAGTPYFSYQARGFAKAVGVAENGGKDTAKLFDTPDDDRFVADSESARIYRGEAGAPYAEVNGFEGVHAYAVSTGDDEAILNDSAGDDTFFGSPAESALYGNGFYNRAKGFENVVANSAEGHDVAQLHGTDRTDHFEMWPTVSALEGVIEPDSSDSPDIPFAYRANTFEEVFAHGNPEQGDVADLYDSSGDDEFVSGKTVAGEKIPSQIFGILSGEGFKNHALDCAQIIAHADNGGTDVAKMFDSVGSDLFVAGPDESGINKAVMENTGSHKFHNEAIGFDGVHAYATLGGVDTANLSDSEGDDQFRSDDMQAALYGEGFYNRAKFFESVNATSVGDGIDKAYWADTPAVADSILVSYDGPEVPKENPDDPDPPTPPANKATFPNVSGTSRITTIKNFDFLNVRFSDENDTNGAIGAMDFVLRIVQDWSELDGEEG
ncbi:MAG TPA: hypothetical protein VE890_00705, partial [Thermoguttaceae bacterium]|nr:hypothetical protein [Thermoguttaceae bacterium]